MRCTAVVKGHTCGGKASKRGKDIMVGGKGRYRPLRCRRCGHEWTEMLER